MLDWFIKIINKQIWEDICQKWVIAMRRGSRGHCMQSLGKPPIHETCPSLCRSGGLSRNSNKASTSTDNIWNVNIICRLTEWYNQSVNTLRSERFVSAKASRNLALGQAELHLTLVEVAPEGCYVWRIKRELTCLTPQPQRAYCEILGDIGARIRK